MTGSASRSAFAVSAGMLVGAVVVIVIISIVVVIAPAQIEIVQDNADQIAADTPGICPGPLRQLSRPLTTLDHQNDALDQRGQDTAVGHIQYPRSIHQHEERIDL